MIIFNVSIVLLVNWMTYLNLYLKVAKIG